MGTLSGNALLAAAEAPAWAALALAAVTGLFGLLAGAAAASVVTTNHERNERFRTRMIESAEQVVADVDAVLQALDRAFTQAGTASNQNNDHAKRTAASERAKEFLEEAKPLTEVLVLRLARLLLVHGDHRVEDQAGEVRWNLGMYADAIGFLIADFDAGRLKDRIDKSFERADERQRFTWNQRNALLEVFHDEIFRYGTFGYSLRRRLGGSSKLHPGAARGGAS